MNEGPDYADVDMETMKQFVEQHGLFLEAIDKWMMLHAEQGDAMTLLCFQKCLGAYFEQAVRILKEGGQKKWKTFLN